MSANRLDLTPSSRQMVRNSRTLGAFRRPDHSSHAVAAAAVATVPRIAAKTTMRAKRPAMARR